MAHVPTPHGNRAREQYPPRSYSTGPGFYTEEEESRREEQVTASNSFYNERGRDDGRVAFPSFRPSSLHTHQEQHDKGRHVGLPTLASWRAASTSFSQRLNTSHPQPQPHYSRHDSRYDQAPERLSESPISPVYTPGLNDRESDHWGGMHGVSTSRTSHARTALPELDTRYVLICSSKERTTFYSSPVW